jgi:predicted membrane channel-forming protein YqfA (hemolysin III family)
MFLCSDCRPPRGRFSHLAMFRIGTVMFIPAYLTVVLFRPFANVHPDDSNPFLMFGACLFIAFIWSTCSTWLLDSSPFSEHVRTYLSSLIHLRINVGSSAVRYCGTTFGYTAISILLNYSE